MNKQVQAIRAEIERLISVSKTNNGFPVGYIWKNEAYKELLSFIDTLPDEQPSKGLDVTDFCKPIDPGIAQCIADNWWEMLGEDEKPIAPNGLEEEIKAYFQGYWPGLETAEQCNTNMQFTPPAIMRLAKHFYKFGQASMRMSEEQGKVLEEAAKKHADNCLDIKFPTLNEDLIRSDVIYSFKLGAQWQKEQMIEDAEEVSLYRDGDFLAIDLNMEELGYTDNDTVKIIIVKEDEK